MKQFVSGLILGIGIGLLICGFVAATLVKDFEDTLSRYDSQIETFYTFTHSYGFTTVQDLIDQTAAFYKDNILLRQTLETLGMGQLGQLLQDIDENFKEIITMSEELHTLKSSLREAQSTVTYIKEGGILLSVVGALAGVWASRR